MDFTKFNSNLKRLIDNFDEIVLGTAMESKDLIADLNVSQLTEGKTEQDKPITPEYFSGVYASAKKSIGAKPPKGTPDLKLTGDFHSSIYAEKTKDYIYTWATDEKTQRLNSKYINIFGLTKKNLAVLSKEIQPNLVKKLTDELLTS